MYWKEFKKAVAFTVAALFLILFGGAITTAGAFSVDVDNLQYTDGDRNINYDFSTGTYGDPVPPNTIGLPEAAIIQKNAADLGFAFGVVPDVGSATLTAPTGVATLATLTEGAAVLT